MVSKYKPKVDLKKYGTDYICVFEVQIGSNENLMLLVKEDSEDYPIAHLAYIVVDDEFKKYSAANMPAKQKSKREIRSAAFYPLCRRLFSVEVTIYYFDPKSKTYVSDSNTSQNTEDPGDTKKPD